MLALSSRATEKTHNSSRRENSTPQKELLDLSPPPLVLVKLMTSARERGRAGLLL